MAYLAILIVKVLDPLNFIVVLAITFLSRQKWIIPVAATAGAIFSETILTAGQFTRSWGQGLISGLLASGIHAVACYWLIGKMKRRREAKNNQARAD